jgi:hypothetical protein
MKETSLSLFVIARLVRATHFCLAKLGRPHKAGDDGLEGGKSKLA